MRLPDGIDQSTDGQGRQADGAAKQIVESQACRLHHVQSGLGAGEFDGDGRLGGFRHRVAGHRRCAGRRRGCRRLFGLRLSGRRHRRQIGCLGLGESDRGFALGHSGSGLVQLDLDPVDGVSCLIGGGPGRHGLGLFDLGGGPQFGRAQVSRRGCASQALGGLDAGRGRRRRRLHLGGGLKGLPFADQTLHAIGGGDEPAGHHRAQL